VNGLIGRDTVIAAGGGKIDRLGVDDMPLDLEQIVGQTIPPHRDTPQMKVVEPFVRCPLSVHGITPASASATACPSFMVAASMTKR
jgi:hypothetical protein